MKPECIDLRQTFFQLLRAGLWERPVEDLRCFPLRDDQWRNLWRFARRQTVSGLVYRGLHFLPESLWPASLVLAEWLVDIERIERESKAMNECVSALNSLFSSAHICHVLQKGQGVADLYAYPLLRECGDIDFYFPKEEDWHAANTLIARDLKLKISQRADGSICYHYRNICVEHHRFSVDLQAPHARKVLKMLEERDGYDRIKPSLVNDEVWLVPSVLMNLVLLNAHLMKHAMGRGIGLRQFCDMARAYHSYKGQYAPYELVELYRKVGLIKWCRLLHGFLIYDLDIDPNDLPESIYSSDYEVEVLRQIIYSGGNFGQHRKYSEQRTEGGWHRKMETLRAYWENMRFSCTIAPREFLWGVWQLVKGQRLI